MNANPPKLPEPQRTGSGSRWVQLAVFGAVCLLVVWFYAWTAGGAVEWDNPTPANLGYNRLVDGLRAGQLNLKLEVPRGLTQLADPLNPDANLCYRSAPYGLHNLSYYQGKIYLYFGITPALVLFWPWVMLTGQYLTHKYAVVGFCTVGFLASVDLLRRLWRRYFPETGAGVIMAGVLALGLTGGVPVMLQRADLCEVPVSCGYALTMLALGAVGRALHEPAHEGRWLAAASLACGLAVGARPSLLFGAVILLVPLAHAWRRPGASGRPRRPWSLLAAAGVPLLLTGLGLMLYNYRRFGNPFEFGQYYQMAGDRQDTVQHFSLRYLWFNFRVYFLQPVRWSATFPFLQQVIAMPPLPAGHAVVEEAFGILTNIPLVALALAAPLILRRRLAEARATLRWFLVAVALLFGMSALVLGLFYGICIRYEVELLPALVLLAVVGILGLEHALVARPGWRRAARCGWGALLAFSVGCNLLMSIEHYSNNLIVHGNVLMKGKQTNEAIQQYEHALRISPAAVDAHINLGLALVQLGRMAEAIAHYEAAIRINPDHVEAHNNLGHALAQTGRMAEAIAHYEQAVRLRPDYALAHTNLGIALVQTGRAQEAVDQFETVLRINPDSAETCTNLGNVLFQMGRFREAAEKFEEALRINPNDAPTRKALSVCSTCNWQKEWSPLSLENKCHQKDKAEWNPWWLI